MDAAPPRGPGEEQHFLDKATTGLLVDERVCVCVCV